MPSKRRIVQLSEGNIVPLFVGTMNAIFIFGKCKGSFSRTKFANRTFPVEDLMNSYLKYALIALGGIALGAAGAMAISRGKINLKPYAAGLISRGLDVKEALSGAVERIKEDTQDLVAEAKEMKGARDAQ